MVQTLYPAFLYGGVPLILGAAYWYLFHYKRPVYLFSSLAPVKSQVVERPWRRWILYFLRIAVLTSLCLALARFQKPDDRSRIPIRGIDILLVLDISESMQLFDDLHDRRTRLEVARQEALTFIDKRENDPIGLVIFSGVALSRCPLTLDKNVLKEILKETDVHTIQVQGTVLSRAILTATNFLKKSQAKSKIMIVLTDGEPTPNDIDPHISIDLAKKLGVRIYTIGIGSEKGGYIADHFGVHRYPVHLNIPLLKRFASETGGKFFLARNSADMKAIYRTIDKLERTEYETPMFSRYFEYFMPFLLLAFLLLLAEIFLSTFLWVAL